MGRAKRHHYVPRTLLRRFCDDAGKLYYAEKSPDGSFGEIQYRNPDASFWRRNHNTILVEGEPSDLAEREYYAMLDDYLAKLLMEIEVAFAQGYEPAFRGEVLVGACFLIHAFMKRSIDFLPDFDDGQLGQAAIDGVKNLLLVQGNRRAAESYVQSAKGHLSAFRRGRNIRVLVDCQPPSEAVSSMLNEFSLRWAVPVAGSSFIVTSKMVYRIGNGSHNGYVNPRVECWMPLSPKRALVMLRDPEGKVPLICTMKESFVRDVNEYATDTSSVVASHSKLLIASLIKGTRQKAYRPKSNTG